MNSFFLELPKYYIYPFIFLITLYCLLTLKGVPLILTGHINSCLPLNSHANLKRQNFSP